MDMIKILERLISIKSNAQQRALQEAKGYPLQQPDIKAYLLQKGIEQLVMEIQNRIYANYWHTSTSLTNQLNDRDYTDEA